MNSQTGVVFAGRADHLHVVRLLKADAVSVVAPHVAVLDERAESAVQEDTAAAAAVQVHVLVASAIHGQVFHPRALDVITADHRKHGCGLCLVGEGTVGIQRATDRELVAFLAGNAPYGGVKPAGLPVPYGHAVAHLKTFGAAHGDLFLAEIAVHGEGGGNRWRLEQHRLLALAAHGYVRAQVQRIAHQVGARADFDRAAAERCDIIDRSLKRAVIRAVNISTALRHVDDGAVGHGHVHGPRHLPVIGSRGEGALRVLGIQGGGGQRGQAKESCGKMHGSTLSMVQDSMRLVWHTGPAEHR